MPLILPRTFLVTLSVEQQEQFIDLWVLFLHIPYHLFHYQEVVTHHSGLLGILNITLQTQFCPTFSPSKFYIPIIYRSRECFKTALTTLLSHVQIKVGKERGLTRKLLSVIHMTELHSPWPQVFPLVIHLFPCSTD